jgi:hypothetical protein
MWGPSLCNDKEIIGRIYCQFCNLTFDGQKDNEFNGAIIDCINSLMSKLQTLKYHSERYSKLEDDLFIEAIKVFKENVSGTKIAIELISEIEAFLMQLKSALDILMKILIPTVGKDFIKTQTFGNKGEEVIKGLTKFKNNKKNVNSRAVDELINLIKYDKEHWLGEIITFRDTVSHYSSLQNYYFKPVVNATGEVSALRPTINGIDTKLFLKSLYENTLGFCQDFISIAMLIPLPAIFGLCPSFPSQMVERYGDCGQYVKFSLNIFPIGKEN